jgi:hypothetical protein
MIKQIKLKQALEAWQNEIISPTAKEKHIPAGELYDMLINKRPREDNEALLDHLSVCSHCMKELKDMKETIEEVKLWDLALPKAAASEKTDWPKNIMTEGGKYSIVIRRSITDKNKGLVSISVNPSHIEIEKIEGKKVVLRDGRGRELLRQKIIDGEASQEVQDLDSIEFHFAVITE